jgi:hypothetical protein
MLTQLQLTNISIILISIYSMQPTSLSLTDIYHMLQHDTILITPALPLNLIAPTEGGTQADGIRDDGAEDDIWA